jgi:hypothetical protein
MRKIKSFTLFKETYDNDVIIIKDLLLDFIDNEIKLNINVGNFNYSGDNRLNTPVSYIRVEIGDRLSCWDGIKMFTLVELGVSILEVIDYCESQGLFLMDYSTIYSPSWQNYVGCPQCLSDDLSNSKGKTVCNRCGFDDVPDSFLLDDWPLTKERLGIIISEGKRISNIQLYFSKVKSVY